MAIHLERRLPAVSSSLPGNSRGPRLTFPYLALLPVGFTMPPPVTVRGGALLPHHFTLTRRPWRFIFCGTFPGLPLPDVIRHCALCSPDFPRQGKPCRDHPDHSANILYPALPHYAPAISVQLRKHRASVQNPGIC